MGCGIIIYSTYPTEIQGTGERMLVQGCLLQQNVLFQKLKRMPRTISREPLCLFIWKALPAVPESRFSYISRAPTHGTAGSHLQGGSSTWTSSLPWIFTHSASVPTPATHTHTHPRVPPSWISTIFYWRILWAVYIIKMISSNYVARTMLLSPNHGNQPYVSLGRPWYILVYIPTFSKRKVPFSWRARHMLVVMEI